MFWELGEKGGRGSHSSIPVTLRSCPAPWITVMGFPGGSVSKNNLPAMQKTAYNAGDQGSIPGLARFPGEGNGNPCLGNPMDRGAWQVTVHAVARVTHSLAINHHHHDGSHPRKCCHLLQAHFCSFCYYMPNPGKKDLQRQKLRFREGLLISLPLSAYLFSARLPVCKGERIHWPYRT